MYDNSSRVIEVDINEILPNRFQPRIQFDEEEILELSDSIKEHGVIQPLVVRTIGDKYEIIAGERRYKASVLAGKETIPVIVKNLNDKDSAEIALIENIQRKNLTPIEEALSYKKILDMGYITQENLAAKLGKSQSAVANKIRLLNLSDEVQEALLENKISERHARSLLKLSTSKQQNELLEKIISERLTVRKLDEEIEKIKNNVEDDSEEDSQKIIEKGEVDMDNNMFGMPSVPQNTQPTTEFDIFGSTNIQPVQPQPVVNTVVDPETQPMAPSFDIFGGSAPVVAPTPVVAEMPTMDVSAPVSYVTPEVPMMPTTQVVPEVPAMGGIQFDANGNVASAPLPTMDVSAPEAPVTPEVSVIPTTPVVPEIPAMGGIQFDANGNVASAPLPTMDISAPVAPVTPEVPVMPTTPVVPEIPVMGEIQIDGNVPVAPQPEEPIMNNLVAGIPEIQTNIEPTISNIPEVPQTAPIIEQPFVNNDIQITQPTPELFSFGYNNINQPIIETEQPTPETSTTPEFKMPEPIIVTDYSKQYDPVMPQTMENLTPTVDFKEVIKAIRECSNKIEHYGFKIDIEEYDLANLYQVIFKIEK